MNGRVEPDLIERRLDKPYDDEWPGHIIAPNETPLASGCRSFLAAAGRALLKMYEDARSAEWKAPFRPEERP